MFFFYFYKEQIIYKNVLFFCFFSPNDETIYMYKYYILEIICFWKKKVNNKSKITRYNDMIDNV